MSLILSIESSCDDSSLALTDIDSAKVIHHKKISQESEHSRYGGVVPELASRLHAVALPRLLREISDRYDDISLVAVTSEPGLSVTLNEGLMMARTFALFKGVPLISVHHLKGHVYSLFIEKESFFPLLVLLVSGGHTMILKVTGADDMEILASSMDDSVGESYDKVAKMMGLGYPGGPIVERLAREGDPDRFDLPVPLRNSPLVSFSFSGLKNAVRLTVESLGGAENMSEKDMMDLSASFQKSVIAHLIQKSKKILSRTDIGDFAIVGGASANMAIRGAFSDLCSRYGIRMHDVPLQYCSDNAAMIGRYALDIVREKRLPEVGDIDITVSGNKKVKSGEKL
jgi:N6-L-threonylcarbamoyladenine synthase